MYLQHYIPLSMLSTSLSHIDIYTHWFFHSLSFFLSLSLTLTLSLSLSLSYYQIHAHSHTVYLLTYIPISTLSLFVFSSYLFLCMFFPNSVLIYFSPLKSLSLSLSSSHTLSLILPSFLFKHQSYNFNRIYKVCLENN